MLFVGGGGARGDSCSPHPGVCRGPRLALLTLAHLEWWQEETEGNLGGHGWLGPSGKGEDKALPSRFQMVKK